MHLSPTDAITLGKIGTALAEKGLSLGVRVYAGVWAVTLASDVRVVHADGRTLAAALQAAFDKVTHAPPGA